MNFNSTLFLTIERQPLSCLLLMLQIEEMKSWKQMKVVLTDFFIVKTENTQFLKKIRLSFSNSLISFPSCMKSLFCLFPRSSS